VSSSSLHISLIWSYGLWEY